MDRTQSRLAAGLLVSLALNVGLLIGMAGRSPPSALGQAVGAGDGFVIATEQTNDQTPVCFVLNTRKPKLLAYRIDGSGQLQLTNARDLSCDLRLEDLHISRAHPKGTKTFPPVKEVCRAVEKEKEKEKDEQKEAKGAKSERNEKTEKTEKTGGEDEKK